MSFTILSKEEFQAHTSQAKEKSFLQSLEMAELLTKRGYSVSFAGWKVNGEIKISTIIQTMPMTGGKLMVIDAGPVCTDDSYLTDFYSALKTFAKEQGALELRIKPYDTYQIFDKLGSPLTEENTKPLNRLIGLDYQHDGLQTGYPNGEPQWHYLKDLSDIPSNNLTSTFNTNAKRLLKKAKQYPISIRPLEREELQIFKDLQDATGMRQGYQSKPLSYYQDFYDSFGEKCQFLTAFINVETYKNQLEQKLQDAPGNNKLQAELKQIQEILTQYGSGEIALASNLIIYDQQETTYLFGGFYPEFQLFNAPILLQEQAMLETINKGIPVYNFLGIAGIFDKSDGVLRFKQNFNGYITRKLGVFHYYPKPFTYKVIQTIKKIIGH